MKIKIKTRKRNYMRILYAYSARWLSAGALPRARDGINFRSWWIEGRIPTMRAGEIFESFVAIVENSKENVSLSSADSGPICSSAKILCRAQRAADNPKYMSRVCDRRKVTK